MKKLKIVMSRKEWENAGLKAGWIKASAAVAPTVAPSSSVPAGVPKRDKGTVPEIPYEKGALKEQIKYLLDAGMSEEEILNRMLRGTIGTESAAAAKKCMGVIREALDELKEEHPKFSPNVLQEIASQNAKMKTAAVGHSIIDRVIDKSPIAGKILDSLGEAALAGAIKIVEQMMAGKRPVESVAPTAADMAKVEALANQVRSASSQDGLTKVAFDVDQVRLAVIVILLALGVYTGGKAVTKALDIGKERAAAIEQASDMMQNPGA